MDLKKEVNTNVVFYLYGGGTLKSVNELLKSLPLMKDQTFFHHVTHDRNDFSNWVADVYGEKQIAQEIKKHKTKESLRNYLAKVLETRTKEGAPKKTRIDKKQGRIKQVISTPAGKNKILELIKAS